MARPRTIPFGPKPRPQKRGRKPAAKKSTVAPTRSLVALNAKVNRVMKTANAGVETVYLSKVLNSANVSSDFASVNLMDYVNFAPLYGNTTVDYANANKWLHKTASIDFMFDTGTETDNIDFTCFLVQLTGIARNKYDTATGNITLTAGSDYNVPSSAFASLVSLNPKLFKILRRKRFMLGNNGVALTTGSAQGQTINTRYSFRFNLNINKTISNPVGNVQQQYASLSPTNQYYVLVFNNNNLADLQYPNMSFQVVHKIICPQ